jgi:hypothetical protein
MFIGHTECRPVATKSSEKASKIRSFCGHLSKLFTISADNAGRPVRLAIKKKESSMKALILSLALTVASAASANVVCKAYNLIVVANDTTVTYSDNSGKVLGTFEAERVPSFSSELDDAKEVFAFREGILIIKNRLTTDESNYGVFFVKGKDAEEINVACRYN